jgi:hypothetical protein
VKRVERNGTVARGDQGGPAHRDGAPCAVLVDGRAVWYHEGLVSRRYGPAVVYPSGTSHWHLDDSYHREGGPAVIVLLVPGGQAREDARRNRRAERLPSHVSVEKTNKLFDDAPPGG